MPDTKPGSRAHTITTVVDRLTHQLGRGVELSEIRDGYESQTGQPAPSSFTAEVSSLKRRGVLRFVGGRASRSLYAPADTELGLHTPLEDDVITVLRAVHAGFRRRGRALTTREVQKEIDRCGWSLASDSPNAVPKYLATLSRARVRGPELFRAPRVKRLEEEAAGGIATNLWLPAEAEAPDAPPAVPRSAADAVRQAVHGAQEDLGRSVSRTELRWWLDRTDVSAELTRHLGDSILGARLADTRKSDQDAEGEEGRLHVVSSRFVCHGGPDVRYASGPPGEVEAALCRLEDTAGVLRVVEEASSLRALEGQIQRGLYPPGLIRLVDARRGLTRGLLLEAARGVAPSDLFELARQVGRGLDRWLAESSLTPDQIEGRQRGLRERQRALEGAEAVLTFAGPAPKGTDLAGCVGTAATVAVEDLKPLLACAADLLGMPEDKGPSLVVKARRLPVPETPGAERFGQADELPLSRLDRVDALEAIFELFPLPTTIVLLTAAHGLLGHVLRDREVLEACLEDVPPGASQARRHLWVALGLLGSAVSDDDLLSGRPVHEDVAAWTLATLLADWDQATDRIVAVDRKLDGSAGRITDFAVARINSGLLLSAVG